VAKGIWNDLSKIGLITLDAHHDLRDGISNGSPVWRLVQAGLMGSNIVQIGISDFANSREYAARAKEYGINVIYRDELRRRPMRDVMSEALDRAGHGGREIYVDLDVDVCDRAVAPACPASVPGGISADELRQAAYFAGADRRVRGLDITEIDATLDAPDQRTIRLAALLVLEASCGVASR
jgi:formiminoglutamase